MTDIGKVIDYKEANGKHIYYIRCADRDYVYITELPAWDIGDELERGFFGDFWRLSKRSSLEISAKRTEEET